MWNTIWQPPRADSQYIAVPHSRSEPTAKRGSSQVEWEECGLVGEREHATDLRCQLTRVTSRSRPMARHADM